MSNTSALLGQNSNNPQTQRNPKMKKIFKREAQKKMKGGSEDRMMGK
jgi:hypothetical protein